MCEPGQHILVTGASGFIALHCVRNLLEAGYRVRGTVRNVSNEQKVKPLKALPHQDHLEIVQLDMTKDEGWANAMNGIDGIMHTACPVVLVGDEDQIVKPAVEGTARVLEAAVKAGVKRLVFTSSTAAVVGGHKGETVNEATWSSEQSFEGAPYFKAKTLSERNAWDFIAKLPESQKINMVAVNPGLVLGPVMSDQVQSSVQILVKHEDIPLRNSKTSTVDVRDVAQVHLMALQKNELNGQRIICTAGQTRMTEIFAIAQNKFPEYFKRDIKFEEGDFFHCTIDNSKVKRMFPDGMISLDKSVTDSIESYIQYGIM